VSVARKLIPAGTGLRFRAGTVTVGSTIKLGHKFAVAPIPDGEAIRKYGQVIGFANGAIPPGGHVHVHNVKLGSFERDYAYASATPPPPEPPTEYRTFRGYDRGPGRKPHQRYGTRNYVAIISTVNCSAGTSKYVAERVRALAGSNSPIKLIPYDEAYESGFEDMPRRLPDLTKIRGMIGYHPRFSLDDILVHVIEYFRSQ
jgi:altronate hydrolase